MTLISSIGSVARSVTVEPVSLLYMLAVFAEMPALQDMLFGRMCLDRLQAHNSSSNLTVERIIYLCDRGVFKSQSNATIGSEIDPETYSRIMTDYATFWGSYFQGLLFGLSVVACIYTGSWSDLFGRKVPLILPPLCSLAAQVVFIVSAVNYFDGGASWTCWLLLGSFFSGVSGGTSSVIANSYGYVTDVTPVESRTRRIMTLEATIFLGMSCGSYLTGSILKSYAPTAAAAADGTYNLSHTTAKYVICFAVIGAIHLLIAIYAALRLRDTRLDPTRSSSGGSGGGERPKVTLRRLFNYRMLLDGLQCVFRRRPHHRRRHLLLLTFAAILCFFGLGVQLTLLFTFVKDQLGWTGADYARFQTIEPLVSGAALISLPLVLLALTGPGGWRPRDTLLAGLGFASRTCGFAAIGFARSWPAMYCVVALLTFANYAVPMVRAMMSKVIAADERGKVFSFLACSQSMVHFVGGYLWPAVYRATSGTFPGAAFEAVAVMQLVALAIVVYLHVTMRPEAEPVPETGSNSKPEEE